MRRSANALVLLMAMLLAALGYRWGESRFVAPLRGDGLEISPDALDFGRAAVQDDFVWKLPLVNRGESPIEIAGFERSCGCASVTPNALTMAPGETRSLQLHLNLAARDDFTYSGGEREFSVELRPLVARAMTPAKRWRVTGIVESPWRIPDYPLRFAPHALVAGSDFSALEFMVIPRSAGEQIQVELAPGSAAAKISSEPHEAALRIALRPDSALAPGAHEFRMTISATAAAGQTTPPQMLKITGRVVPDVAVDPSYLRLDGNDSRPLRVRLTSRTGTPFEVLRVDAPGELLRAERVRDEQLPDAETLFDISRGTAVTELSVVDVVFLVKSARERAGTFPVSLQVVVPTP